METIIDEYVEHEQHRKGENGKIVPFYKNMDRCSTCFSERQRILKNGMKTSLKRSPYEPDEYSFYE